MSVKLRGIDKVIRNLNKNIQEIKGVSLKGLIRAGIIIRRDMDQTSPTIPVNFGNLRASWSMITSNSTVVEGSSPMFTGDAAALLASLHQSEAAIAASKARSLSKGVHPVVVFGFSAFYTWFVHESVDDNFQRPGSGAKFFEASLNRNRDKVLSVIKREAGLK